MSEKMYTLNRYAGDRSRSGSSRRSTIARRARPSPHSFFHGTIPKDRQRVCFLSLEPLVLSILVTPRSARLEPSPGRPRHHPSFRGSFSAGSTPIFASKYAFCSIFQYLQDNHLFFFFIHLLVSKFAMFLQNFLEFQLNVAYFYKILETKSFRKFCKNL